ncbi:MAG: hypothetical protein LBG89_03490 [Rickettsiales bacterium]|jgi:hypothetical protein|nr:hypothetical protein [Rickettsiales bacterium]
MATKKVPIMANDILLLLCGESGSGKEYFFDNIMPSGVFRKLISMTTRDKRAYETDGVHYHFVSEEKYFAAPRATTLFVNEKFWRPGEKKWLYGVSESEFESSLGHLDDPLRGGDIAYDVIEPKYAAQLIDWVTAKEYKYDPLILHFQKPANNLEIAAGRANMANDVAVRTANTCTLADFWRAGINPDYSLLSSKGEMFFPSKLIGLLNHISSVAKIGTQFRLPRGARVI